MVRKQAELVRFGGEEREVGTVQDPVVCEREKKNMEVTGGTARDKQSRIGFDRKRFFPKWQRGHKWRERERF